MEDQTAKIEHRHALELDLVRLGKERTRALEQADESLTRIVKTARDAIAAGVTRAEIQRLSGVTRQTLHERLKQPVSEAADVPPLDR